MNDDPTFTVNIEWLPLGGDESRRDPDLAAIHTTMGDLVGHIESLTADGFQTETDVIAAAWAFLQAAAEEASA